MKKICYVLLFLVVLICFVSCTENSPKEGETTAKTTQTGTSFGTAELQGYIFDINGNQLYCNQDGKDALAVLGEYQNKFESHSCAFNGMEISYYYPSMTLVTYTVDNSSEKVLSIYLNDDSVSTKEGISIGDSKDKVQSIYGEPTKTGSSGVTYTKNGASLVFTYNENKVDSILYSLDIE